MKHSSRILALLLLVSMLLIALAGCDSGSGASGTTAEPFTEVDYAGTLGLDMSSPTLKQEVTVKCYIDGDTTHFYVPTTVTETGVLKARYLAINTPESTGKIEPWGKAASKFTKEKLSGADSIIIESDDGKWNVDSTGGRHLVWVWYRPAGENTYRNLNIEILQNGLAIASSSAQNRYGDTAMKAIDQAKKCKLHVHSGKADPDFYYGEAQELTLRELRANLEYYNGVKVAFEGVVTRNYNNGVYVEDYDEETDMYFGMYVYYGFSMTSGLENLAIGNRTRVVGTLSFWETGGTWQVAGLQYRPFVPDDPGNLRTISTGNPAAYVPTTAEKFLSGKVTFEAAIGEEEEPTMHTFDYAEMAMNTSISMTGLTVKSIYTTNTEGSASKGAMTLTCDVGGKTVKVRTDVLYDASGALVTEDAYKGKIIDVKGIIDYFDGTYQIKVFSVSDITIKDAQ